MENVIYDKAKIVLKEKGLQSKPLCSYGDWVVSERGDIVSMNSKSGYYCIVSFRIFEDDWIDHLRTKTWFTEIVERDFRQALYKAKDIVHNIPVLER